VNAGDLPEDGFEAASVSIVALPGFNLNKLAALGRV